MNLSQNNIKLIFGLKVKQLRADLNLSLSELAKKCGMSASYLNEIESGKKYPKSDKIAALSKILNVPYDELVSLKLSRGLTPVGELLESNILEQLPLDHYGIDINKFIALMSTASMQLSALVSTIIEMAKVSESSENNFSRTALRTYKEFNGNYFSELENAVDKFSKKYKIDKNRKITFRDLKHILINNFNYRIDETAIKKFRELNGLRTFVEPGEISTLFLNDKLSDSQKAFAVGKELGYNFLGITDRSYQYSEDRLDSFDQLLNNYHSSYFSTALILNKRFLIDDLRLFFSETKWKPNSLLKILNKYNASPEMFFQRLTNLAPKYFGIGKFYFIRFNTSGKMKEFRLTKDLRLNVNRNPGGYQSAEHYCRRWISAQILMNLRTAESKKGKVISGALNSEFINSEEKYFNISLAKESQFKPGNYYSVTIGFYKDKYLPEKIKFISDNNIPTRTVGETCEMCSIKDCAERAAAPERLNELIRSVKIEEALNKLKTAKRENVLTL